MAKHGKVEGVPPAITLMNMINGAWLSQAISVVAKLGIADRLSEGPQTVAALAEETQTHASSLHRLLRTVSGAGIFAEDDDGRFRLTPMALIGFRGGERRSG